MKIRRYLGKNTQEAILKVKMDLGNDAVILNTRKVRQKGFFKIFAKPMIEVLAAIDDDYKDNRREETRRAPEHAKKSEAPIRIVKGNESSTTSDQSLDGITQLQDRVNDMENMLQKIYNQVQGSAETAGAKDQNDGEAGYSKLLQVFYNNLIKNEVDTDIAKKIINAVRTKVGDNPSVNDAASVLYNVISGTLGKPETINISTDGKPKVVAMVGPTGVGKTTTLAKIAANFSLNQQKKVGLITADTYRIAAVEQLKTYSEILGLPLSVVYTENELGEAIKAFSDKDLILIDTAGRSHRNKSQFDELKSLIQVSNCDEVFLLLSTTTSIRNCKEIINNYSFLGNYRLIFTKLDETPISGIILNTAYTTGKKLSYVTTGQSVPDDIEVADVDKITKNLLGSIV